VELKTLDSAKNGTLREDDEVGQNTDGVKGGGMVAVKVKKKSAFIIEKTKFMVPLLHERVAQIWTKSTDLESGTEFKSSEHQKKSVSKGRSGCEWREEGPGSFVGRGKKGTYGGGGVR